MSSLIEVWICTSHKADHHYVANGAFGEWVEAILYSEKKHERELTSGRGASATIEGRTYYLHRAVLRVPDPNNPILSVKHACDEVETGSHQPIDRWYSTNYAGGCLAFPAFPDTHFDLIHDPSQGEWNMAVMIVKDDV